MKRKTRKWDEIVEKHVLYKMSFIMNKMLKIYAEKNRKIGKTKENQRNDVKRSEKYINFKKGHSLWKAKISVENVEK